MGAAGKKLEVFLTFYCLLENFRELLKPKIFLNYFYTDKNWGKKVSLNFYNFLYPHIFFLHILLFKPLQKIIGNKPQCSHCLHGEKVSHTTFLIMTIS